MCKEKSWGRLYTTIYGLGRIQEWGSSGRSKESPVIELVKILVNAFNSFGMKLYKAVMKNVE